MKNWKENISFMLIEPKEPGNIGASARAMKNMRFKNLELVNPGEFLTEEARRSSQIEMRIYYFQNHLLCKKKHLWNT